MIPLLTALAVTGACTDASTDAAPEASDGSSTPAMTEEARRTLEAELVEADREFARQVKRHGIGGWLSGFASSGRMVAGGESYIGQEGIRRAMLPVFADTMLEFTWDPTYAEVAASGDLGYTIGTYEMTTSEAGTAGTVTGTYLTVWRRQPNGEWKVQADIGNPAPAGGGASD